MIEYVQNLSEEKVAAVRRTMDGPRLALHVAMVTGKDDTEVKRCRDELMSQHLSDCLKRWMEWSESEQWKKLMIDANSSRECKIVINL